MLRNRLFSSLLALSALAAMKTQAADLTIQLTGIEANRGGSVQVALYKNAKAFENYDRGLTVAAISQSVRNPGSTNEKSAQTISFTLHDIPAGQYAVHYFHDVNSNQLFDSEGNRPLEGWGFSGARHLWQSPTFKKAAFAIDDESVTLPIKTFYVK